MAADDLVGDRLSEDEQTALHPPEDCDESDEEEERITVIKKVDKDEAIIADGADDTWTITQWNSVAEPEMIDFGVWTKVSAPGVNIDQVEPAFLTEREKAEEGDIDDLTTVKSAEIESFSACRSMHDDPDDKPERARRPTMLMLRCPTTEATTMGSRSSKMTMRRRPPRARNASRKARRNHLLSALPPMV